VTRALRDFPLLNFQVRGKANERDLFELGYATRLNWGAGL
jgi:hypothetical protein